MFSETLPAIIKFSLPVVLIPLADPLMSLIDSVCIGRMTGSVQQLAALGPCSLIFNFAR
jgi:O-antigen/teichoic acid export membrane protein